MMADDVGDRPNMDPRDEAERYRQAAEDALDQLDWTVNYLYRIHKTDLARGLAKNGSSIRRRISDRP
jgi:hypothetical protein